MIVLLFVGCPVEWEDPNCSPDSCPSCPGGICPPNGQTQPAPPNVLIPDGVVPDNLPLPSIEFNYNSDSIVG